MSKISKSGIYDLTLEEYLSDCCIGPSVSSSGLRKLIETCPALFKQEQKKTTKAMQFGSAAHLAFLEPEKLAERVVVSPHAEYRTDAAKAWRDEQIKNGLIPLKKVEFDSLTAMSHALRSSVCGDVFSGGEAEKSIIWQDPETKIWCKTRPDYLKEKEGIGYEYKTTGSVKPDDFARVADGKLYQMQVAWHLEGLEAIKSNVKEIRIIAQETDAPYLPQEFIPDSSAIEYGRGMNRMGLRILANCIATDNWHGYRGVSTPDRDGPITLFWPQYAMYRMEEMLTFAPKPKEEPEYPGNPMMAC